MGGGNRVTAWELLRELSLIALGIIVAVAIAIWLIVRIRARYRDNEDPAVVDHQMLTQMVDLHREGDLSDEEYRSIKGRLIERIDDSMRSKEQTE